jgi:hypothetical protein
MPYPKNLFPTNSLLTNMKRNSKEKHSGYEYPRHFTNLRQQNSFWEAKKCLHFMEIEDSSLSKRGGSLNPIHNPRCIFPTKILWVTYCSFLIFALHIIHVPSLISQSYCYCYENYTELMFQIRNILTKQNAEECNRLKQKYAYWMLHFFGAHRQMLCSIDSCPTEKIL